MANIENHSLKTPPASGTGTPLPGGEKREEGQTFLTTANGSQGSYFEISPPLSPSSDNPLPADAAAVVPPVEAPVAPTVNHAMEEEEKHTITVSVDVDPKTDDAQSVQQKVQRLKLETDCGTAQDEQQQKPNEEKKQDMPAAFLKNPSLQAGVFSAVHAPIDYVRGLPSKGVRSILMKSLNSWMGVSENDLQALSECVDSLHTSSLILDDIEDASPLRRGMPAAHVVFGAPQAINSATFAYVRALAQVSKLGKPELVTIVLEELENLFHGQAWDLYYTFHQQPPTIDQYLNIIDAKTGGLFQMLVRLMVVMSEKSTSIQPLVPGFLELAKILGRYFQIRDDYMNLFSKTYNAQKGFAEDLDEGKFSYPLLYALSVDPTLRDVVTGIFRNSARPLADQTKRFLLDKLKATGAAQATYDLLLAMEATIQQQVSDVEEHFHSANLLLRILLDKLSVQEF